MKKTQTHKSFGEVTVSAKRITVGGNEVVDAVDEKDVERTLLTGKQYWGIE